MLPSWLVFNFLADLDASVPEQLQRGSDVCLQLVFHTSQTQKLHLPLKTLHDCCNLQASVMDTQLRLVVAVLHREGRGKGRLRGGRDSNTPEKLILQKTAKINKAGNTDESC